MTDKGRGITELPPQAGRMLGVTLLFEALLVELCRNMPVHQVAKMAVGSDRRLRRLLDSPNAAITFDKFHILKIINEAVGAVRREEAKTNPLLKKTRYIFIKNDANLTNKQRTKKQQLKLANLNLQSMQALNMREAFQQIDHADTETAFTELLHEWLDWVSNSALRAMRKAVQTVQQHSTGIVNWKKSQLNNGNLEGLNSIIQAAKRKARGYGKKHFASIAFLLTGKLNLQTINAYLPTRFA